MRRKLISVVLCGILAICILSATALADPGTTPQYTRYGRGTVDGVVYYDITYNETGTVKFVLLESGMAQPTKTQVDSLQDAGGSSVSSPYSGSVSCSAGVEVILPIDFASLAPNKYNLFVVCNDGYGNISDVLWLLMDGEPSFEIKANVTFNVTDGTNPISGATVKVGSETKTTDGSGNAAFTLSGGDYNYLVRSDGYRGVWGNYTADAQTDTETVTLTLGEGGYFSAVLNVKDDKGTNLNNASVTIGSDTNTADANGNVEFFLTPGTYSYTSSAMGRLAGGGSITISDDNITENVVLATDPAGADIVINSHQKGKLGEEIDAILSANSLGAGSVGSLTVHGGVMDADDFSYTGIKKLISVENVLTSVDLSDTTLDGNILPESAFYYGVNLTSIILPDSVTEIGFYAFAYCSSLTSVTFPENVTKIGDSVFEFCSSLNSVTFPAGVTNIGNNLFTFGGTGVAPVKDVYMLSVDPGSITVNANSFANGRIITLRVPGSSIDNYYNDTRDGDATDRKWYGMYISDPDGAAPVIKGIAAGWYSGPDPYFEFSTDFPGQYYYAVVDDGASEPIIDTSGTGTDIGDSLDGYFEISGMTTAKDVYIVLKSGDGKLSNTLKMDIPAKDAAPVNVTVAGHVSGNVEDEINAELTESNLSFNYGKVGGLTVSGGTIDSYDAEFITDHTYYIAAADFSGTSFESDIVPEDFIDWSDTLKTIVLPASVTEIGEDALCELSVLESVTLGSAVPPVVGDYVFYEVPDGAAVLVPKGSMDAYLSVDDGNTSDAKWYGLIVAESVANATISPATGVFDKNPVNKADVSTVITWNDASSVTDVKAGGISIGAGNYSVTDFGSNAALTIKKEYLETQPNENLDLVIEFDYGDTEILTVAISDTTPATVNPTLAAFDKNPVNQADVSTTITWNSASSVTNVKAGGTSIGAGNYSVIGNTLTIKKGYLATQAAGSLTLTIEFNTGNPATLKVTINDTTPEPTVSAVISPVSGTFDKYSPADVSTTITWNSATSVTDVKAGGVSIGAGNYTVSGNTLTVKKGFLAAQSVGNLVLTIGFDKGDPAALTVAVSDTTPKTYTVTFDAQGGTVSPSNKIVTVGGAYGILPMPVKAGNDFGGWYTQANGGGTQVTESSAVSITANQTLYAKWTAQKPSANLSGITLSAGSLSPAFSQAVTRYTVSLGENDGSVTVTPVKAYDNAVITIDGKKVSNKTVTLANGRSATVTVKVTYGGTSKTYMLTINRPKSTNCNLAALNAKGGTFDSSFDPNDTEYTLTLAEGTKSVIITDITASANAHTSFTRKTYTLRNGEWKTVKITVRAQSGAKKVYTIQIHRLPSTDMTLKSLNTSSRRFSLTPAFSPGITNYSITMPASSDSMTLYLRANGYKASATINGSKRSSYVVRLGHGGSTQVIIRVTSQAGNWQEYVVTVSRP